MEVSLLKIDLYLKSQKEPLSKEIQFTDTSIEICDRLIERLMDGFSFNKQDVNCCYFLFSANNISIIIKDYTLSDTVYMKGFINTQSHINLLKCTETNLDIVGQYMIDTMQVNSNKLLIGHCSIGELTVGTPNDMTKPPEVNNFTDVDSIDIRECTIEKLRVNVKTQRLNIQGTKIKQAIIGNISRGNKKIGQLHIWENTYLQALKLFAQFELVKIDDAKIDNIYAQGDGCIEDIIIVNSIIDYAFRFSENFFCDNCDKTEKWMLIEKSANSDGNVELRAHANYKMLNKRINGLKWYKRIPQYFLKATTGFGYKPFRIFIFAAILILVFSIVICITGSFYPLIESSSVFVWSSFSNSLYNIGESILLSSSAFVGSFYGVMQILGIKIIALFETAFGIICLAMFVNALYIKYGK